MRKKNFFEGTPGDEGPHLNRLTIDSGQGRCLVQGVQWLGSQPLHGFGAGYNKQESGRGVGPLHGELVASKINSGSMFNRETKSPHFCIVLAPLQHLSHREFVLSEDHIVPSQP